MTGSEAIKILGEKLYTGFSLENENTIDVYKQVYQNIYEGLNNKNKGAFVIGNVGVGKSAMMKIMQKLFIDTPAEFIWLNSSDLKDMMEYMKPIEIKERYGKELKKNLYIDDVGSVSTSFMVYGNPSNIFSELINERYDLFKLEGFKTHLSSNLATDLDEEKYPNVKTIKSLYGERCLDRIYEMCELVSWEDKSKRK